MVLLPGAWQFAAGKTPDKYTKLLGDAAHRKSLKIYIYRKTQTMAGHGLHMPGASDSILSAMQKLENKLGNEISAPCVAS